MWEPSQYWAGEQPRDDEDWIYAEFTTVLDDINTRQALFEMHGRYVKQWNDVELDPRLGLFKCTHRVHGAKVLRAHGRFVLLGQGGCRSYWILEIVFSQSFKEFYERDLRRHAINSAADVQSIHLHWVGQGKIEFNRWMLKERAAPEFNASRQSFLGALRSVIPRPRPHPEAPNKRVEHTRSKPSAPVRMT